MRYKGLWITVLILAIMITCGLIFFTLANSVVLVSNSTSISLDEIFSGESFLPNNVKAEAEETLSIDTGSDLVTLILENQFGNINIQGTDSDQITVNIHKTVWGTSAEDAQEKLNAISYEIIEDEQTVTIQLNKTELPDQYQGQIDFEIEVPERIGVKIGNESGFLSVQKIKGDVNLSNNFGDVSVDNIQEGAVMINVENGVVTLGNLLISQYDLTVENSFGDINLSQVSAKQANCFSENGAINLEQVNISQEMEISDQFGEIYFEQGTLSDLTITSSNGIVDLSGLQIDNRLFIESDFGDISLNDVYASQYDIESKNGVVTLDGAIQAVINISTDFGAIDVTHAQDAQIDLQTKNGDITFIGNLIEADHNVQSDFGSITIRLPANQSIAFDLRTEFGEIESEHEVTLSGSLSTDHWIGRLNQGGGLLTVETQNGAITLEKSYAEEE